MRIQGISLVALIVLAHQARCERLYAGGGAVARWFGVTAADLTATAKAGGRPDYAEAPSGRPDCAEAPSGRPDYAKAPSGGPDYAKASSGRPLRIKARFVRDLTDGEAAATLRRGKDPGGRLSFLVAAEGGEIRCEMGARAKGADVVRGMKRATPLVIHGTLDARRNVFLADAVVQGWGRDQMEGGY